MSVDQFLTISLTLSIVLGAISFCISIVVSQQPKPVSKKVKKPAPKQSFDAANRIYAHDGKLIFCGDISKAKKSADIGIKPIYGNFEFFK